ncbi:hypothetical protein TCAL_09359 [Tigriopus californicus]|uniref:Innexin n=1 Tax=Tigriopus californicus TaxID=6832 RepID=A0A553PBP0_TIGCA|nr:innexin inx2-like [Tigriopus californicus]TRY75101.1 hypothetical protein TCAL_09359 [Tigriopus californicus]|eukprot:TCALIF_09359-PA protein Name:"Similar to Inx2 Innexin inx2 (Drosophila melanogaster)" AED:0.05 eAED:0.05 QI:0/0/0/1/1/1/3/0/381
MLGLFKQLQDFLKFDQVWIDNNIFRLHYKGTVIVFVLASLLVTSRQYIGDPIDCMVDGIPGGIMDTYCWIHSTFSIPTRWKIEQGKDAPHPGVAPLADMEEGEEVKHHAYYQWVCFFLFFEAILFYVPRYLWKTSEGGKIKMLVQDLMEPIINEDSKQSQIDTIVKYFRETRGTHALYAFRYFACEVLNFVNIILQIYFIDFFLGFEFSTYGLDVLSFSEMEPESRGDPMHIVFPKVTKCTFNKYGPSGTIEPKDGLCVLPLNIINEKMFIFIWFWLVIVAIVTGIFLLYRIAVLLGPQIRVALITVKGSKSTKRSDVEAILDPASLSFAEKLGDWLVLYFVCKNLDALAVNDLIRHIHKSEAGDNSNTETLKMKPQSSQV